MAAEIPNRPIKVKTCLNHLSLIPKMINKSNYNDEIKLLLKINLNKLRLSIKIIIEN